ncbi:inorganic phosphate transporter [Natrialbaceae archaeon AArc-T1-2]|uniref:inorganic phosphate transporter n=1 Tax=Natrialbaceae archaeon AArc-T1-2 TaxID=3053904 RepID=UPI00255A7261|nr:inorganic phosphate transporter [Natrialbaceae archaeon AArc-T1-2]WIV68205.1 anion permease [Natrialbaceae archaeon AArc-T1-2]
MVAVTILLVFAAAASLFAAWTIGASSSGATPFAPAVGANALTTMRAAFIVGTLGFAGAVLQGAAVTETVGEGLIQGVTLSPIAATLALVIAAFYIGAGVFKGYPIATAFAITGSVVGVGLAMGGEPAWGEYTEIGLYWLLTPVMVAPPSYVFTKLLLSDRVSNQRILPVFVAFVAVIVVHMEFLLLGSSGEEASIADTAAATLADGAFVAEVAFTVVVAAVMALYTARAFGRHPFRTQRRFLLALGGLVAFTAGAGKVGLAVGPLLPLADDVWGTVPITAILLFGGVGILAGSWMLAPRMIKALSQDYAMLGPDRSIGVLIPSFVIAQLGVFFGIPMSFNEIFISAIVGTGYAAGGSGVSREKLFYTTVIWIGSIIFSLVVGYVAFMGVEMAIEAL